MPDEPAPDPRRTHPKTREDDARGTPAGAGTVALPNGSRIGNPPFVATEEQREKVRELAQVFPIHARHYIARIIGCSVSTLDKHFGDDMELGRATMLANVGGQLLARAIDAGDVAKVKGDLDAQKFIMARLGGWSTKLEVTGKDGGPVRHATYDLSKLSDDDKRALLPVLDQLLESGDAGGSSSE